MCKFIKNIILKFKKKNMRELTKDEVYYALWHLIRENEQTTTLEVKKFLREQNFFATQAQVSKFMQEILNDSNDLKTYSNGTHLIYEDNFDENNDGSKHALDDVTKTIDEDGTIKYTNSKGELHRTDGPAIDWNDGHKFWYQNGKFHREDGPAVEYKNGSKIWFLNDQYHREDGPAIEWHDGDKEWLMNGQLHREDGPAIEYTDGTKKWYINGEELTEEEFNNFTLNKINEQTTKSNDVTKTVDKYGTIKYTNSNGELHRTDGPAVEYKDGPKFWYQNGKPHREDGPAIENISGYIGYKNWYQNGQLHREDGPAVEWNDGSKEWWLNNEKLTEEEFNEKSKKSNDVTKIIDHFGIIMYYNNLDQLHREDGPAVEWPDGHKVWYQNDKLHREDGPAIEWVNGHKAWYVNGKRHRTDGPAFEDKDGTKHWYQNGLLHRVDGPAVEWSSGSKSWYLNGKRHRVDGPAVENVDRYKEWWLNGEKLTQEEFNNKTNSWFPGSSGYLTQEEFNNKFKYILKTVLISDIIEQSPNNWVVFDKNKNVYHIYPEHYSRDNVRCYFSKTENIKIQDTRSRRVRNIK